MQAWFLSDIHLQDINEHKGIVLMGFLEQLLQKKEITHLFLLGDIFDLWIGPSQFFVTQFDPLIAKIRELKNQGVEIHYFEGNHDMHLKGFWDDVLGIPVHTKPFSIDLFGKRFRMEHGDFINPADKPYLRYRKLIRSDVIAFLSNQVPGVLIHKLGDYLSKKSRSRSRMFRENFGEKLREMIRNYAEQQAKRDDFDFLITGHVHVQDMYEFKQKDKTVVSANLGSWFDEPKALVYDGSAIKFVQISPPA